MTDRIKMVAEFSVVPGQRENFETVLTSAIEAARNNPGILEYAFHFDAEEEKFYALETYRDADAFLEHFRSMGENLAAAQRLAPVTRFELFGNVDEAFRSEVAPLGADIRPLWNGFSRL